MLEDLFIDVAMLRRYNIKYTDIKSEERWVDSNDTKLSIAQYWPIHHEDAKATLVGWVTSQLISDFLAY